MQLIVSDVYTQDVITVAPSAPVSEARTLMETHGIRRLPVVHKDELVGIVTLLDLMKAAPSPATSLSVWEINYLVDKVKVEDVMARQVRTVNAFTDLRIVAGIMLEHKIGGIPVVEDERVVGIVTESDIFRALIGVLEDSAASGS